jgi:hypothetical protein
VHGAVGERQDVPRHRRGWEERGKGGGIKAHSVFLMFLFTVDEFTVDDSA